MKLGILGGTFDPIHRGHIELAKAARTALNLDKILLIPSGTPPHKPSVNASGEHRFEMAKIATQSLPELECSRHEVDRQGKSYTIETIEHFEKEYPQAKIYFIVGADSIPEIPGWYDAERLYSKVVFAVAARPGTELGDDAPIPFEYVRIPMEAQDVASHQIRDQIRQGEDVTQKVNPEVLRYIEQEELYKS